MGETDPFVCLLCLPEEGCRSGPFDTGGGTSSESRRAARPAAGGHPGEYPRGDRVGVAHSYLTPGRPWHTIWRTLANGGE
ncbi:hypothetical protein GCM10010095_53470 [Streptomyces anthocyanicus]|uniref:Uncharacterized protein n=1 Tax=Streptomyces violaceolatus TaxID=67378 RepID=A0ABN3TA70_9ACTN|nr:predicted protein [Streptomyces lividans TK24]BDD76634.1 hypothetical protein JCM4020_72540 [Streptomyces coelicolor]BDE43720.1 hypothetical protein SLITK23_69650 [Streptomyces lividans]GGL61749.1 hypothetical protein GCM10010095_53470 [Streptomyces anthocyanicus]GHA68577.1 hypothetical protein GCM10010391_63040 [Streptomyces anthocyanicus]